MEATLKLAVTNQLHQFCYNTLKLTFITNPIFITVKNLFTSYVTETMHFSFSNQLSVSSILPCLLDENFYQQSSQYGTKSL